jgi:AcrR family transcriptional regulator
MLDQGHHVIRERGLTVGLDDIRMEDLIAAAEVPRSSVWRIWTAKADYAADLLVSAVDPHGADLLRTFVDQDTLDLAEAQLAAHADRLHSPAARRGVLEEVVRTAVEHNHAVFAVNCPWRTYVALLASLPAIQRAPVRQAIADRMYEAEREFAARMGEFYAAVARRVGIRLRRADAGWEAMALACSAVVEGLALRSEIAEPGTPAAGSPWPRLPTIGELVAGPRGAGSPEEWTTAGIAILGIIDAFTEPDPELARD